MKLLAKSILTAICLGAGVSASATTAPTDSLTAYMVADAHLDTQWNWDVQTTIREYVWNTINQNLFLLEQYPDYIFNFEGGIKYSFMKEYYPREYALMKNYIKSGRWHISGASWEASDAIVPSAESFIRNIMQGQQYYRDEFGVESTDIFLPDCFGFSWSLPTIANHCGLIGFSSQKLGWRDKPMHPGGKKFPFVTGLWRGVDGSQIMLAHGFGYGQRYPNVDLSQDVKTLNVGNVELPSKFIRYYGVGDIGGSPTINSVLSVIKGKNGNGPIKIKSVASDQLFRDYMPYSAHPELEVYDGELLMDLHGTACYTSQAAMKLYNRQNEQLGDASERAAVIADYLGISAYPTSKFTESWRRFLWHQFHDDLTGTSIPRAYEFSWNDELLSLKQFSDLMTSAVGGVASKMDTRTKGTPIVMYNPLGFDNVDVVEIEVPAKEYPASVKVTDQNGKQAKAQIIGFANGKAKVLIEASVPATGFAVYDVVLNGKGKNANAVAVSKVENSAYVITFDNNGDITSLYDKANGKEIVKQGEKIRLALFTHNKSFEWPAWELERETLEQESYSITGNVKVTLVENGALRKTVLVEKEHDGSVFKQYVRLYEGSLANRIDFYNEVDWSLSDALLKAEFPLAVTNEKATYDLGIGAVERGINTITANEVYAHYWTDLTDKSGNYGVTVLNDCKYGWDKPNANTVRLTLLHTPSTNKDFVYQNRQDLGHHSFTYSILPHSGKLDRAKSVKEGDRLNQRIKAFVAQKHTGTLGKSYSFAHTDAENLVIKAVKGAEKGDEYVVRVYETAGKGVNGAAIVFAGEIAEAVEADGTEKAIGKATFSGNKLMVNAQANGIRTYRIRFADKKAVTAPKYETLALAYDKKCFSYNEFRKEGGGETEYSYPQELIPAEINVDGVPFKMEKYELLNGMMCNGNVIKVPAGYNKVYFLAAAATPANDDLKATVKAGNVNTEIVVPSYTGFIGQWGHTGHTTGYLKDVRVAFTATHRHSYSCDQPYEFAYMYLYGIDVPKGVTEITLPNNKKIVVFAATAVNETVKPVTAASQLFRTSNVQNEVIVKEEAPLNNLLKNAAIIGYSGFVRRSESPEMIIDGNAETKWSDSSILPNYLDFDLKETKEISGWRVTNAGVEGKEYITSDCFLLGKEKATDEWRTLDYFTDNKDNIILHKFPKVGNIRYLRLMVTQPVQPGTDNSAASIYELEVY